MTQMDDGYMEQFPIGAINHIGLPESTLPKEVRRVWHLLLVVDVFFAADKAVAADSVVMSIAGGAGPSFRPLCTA